MLIGQYKHSVDVKGRLNIPVKFRDDLGDFFYVTKGLDGCLFVLSCEEWQSLQERVSSMPLSKCRSLQRFFFSGACELIPDKQGRVLLPQHLRDYAGINRFVTLIGASNRVEIWNSEKWEIVNSSIDDLKVIEVMSELGV